jgi:mRNA interferase RelE/StbE
MAGFELRYHSDVVRKDIPRLDAPTRKRIKQTIEQKLTTQPEEFAKPLAYTRTGLWSLRVGAWRVIFAMSGVELWILRIGHRREVYDALDRKIPGAE